MKKTLLFLLALALTVLAAFLAANALASALLPDRTPAETVLPRETAVPAETESAPTLPETEETLPETTEGTLPEKVYDFTPEEKKLLKKIAMAERGDTFCPECIALVMRTVLNRVESDRFPSTVRGVIYAQDQFTPAMDGTLEKARPHELCDEALERIETGWDESQGALYYEWCVGESWHSQNLQLLFSHCDTRFYR